MTIAVRSSDPARITHAGILYGSALLQGITLVSFPAASGILKSGSGLTDAAYGAIFLPQVAFAVLGALAGGVLSDRLGLYVVLAISLAANAVSQFLLASSSLAPTGGLFPLLLLGTGFLGFGFGLSGAPFNSLPRLLFPRRDETALVALHSAIGLGLALGPLLLQRVAVAGVWSIDPLALGIAALLLGFAALGAMEPAPHRASLSQSRASGPTKRSVLLLLCVIAAMYAFAEGTLSNWIVVFVSRDRGLSAGTASAALSAFWLALVAGRLIVSALLTRIPGAAIWRALPFAILAAFFVVPRIGSGGEAIAAFAFAGLACSAFFPLTVATASARFPAAVPLTSSLLTAALMIGVGLGSFVVGGLSSLTTLTQLYWLSAVYPAAILLLMLVDVRLNARTVS